MKTVRVFLRILPIAGILGVVSLSAAAYRTGILTDSARMAEAVSALGSSGPLLFIGIQIIQVIIPILPGGVSCLAGAVMFGPVYGAILNYIGICVGSIVIFLIARRFGRPLLEHMFSASMIMKYDSWTGERRRFEKLFAAAIFFPFAPDDFLCALAGTTRISAGKFAAIIILGKPVSIVLYSLFLETGWKWLLKVV